ncbi:MAG: DUF1640 domain-containing protein [Nitrosomonas sp.]|nr:DUF1640 domain-containing protein [Nitrosomonas sp.]MBP7111697.1 DUF1640 domain-containing protein [Nitrosomonas sp.]
MMASVTFDTLKFIDKLEKAGVPRDQAAAIAEAQKDAFAEAMDTQLFSKSDLMEMENRLIKWSVGLALGQVAVIAALVKLL